MKRLLLTYTLALFLLPVKAGSGELSPADYVNPFIGTTNFGTTNPGAILSQWYDVCRTFQGLWVGR